ncbi:SRPBCC family protein [Blastococcus xanthinilyticus]|uniref:Carbon monoxide dehydrogenase subunit G n=1 Tax=Blastococcus xanthinilyticus TaxID=1564164 RepID=A0A5S5D0C5_9ACTN|nr:SRPBCC family protein [Blastococcus xanthinilyticus]TYP88049.1 carbon monoxide dehydrogenase subunit G [Blastococcus xanthinilyticus]
MQLENSFTVPVPVDEAWRVLLDIERIAPCMPGAALDSVDGDDFTGRVKVKLGPINLTYQGKASFVEKDEAAHRAVIDARGKDQRGNGTAAAVVTAQLKAEGSVTRVDVLTDLNITGRPAQFGRGVMTDVGNKLLGQFADKLAAQLGEGDAQGDAERAAASETPVQKAAATATGVVEEVAASAEQAAGEGATGRTVKKAAAATKKAAASATDKVSGQEAGSSEGQEKESATTETPAKATAAKTTAAKAAPAKKAAAGKATGKETATTETPAKATAAKVTEDKAEHAGVPAATDSAPAARDTAPAAKAPSGPPKGPTAPPGRPSTGAPLRSVPGTGPSSGAPKPKPAEPEPIDLLEVAGGAAFSRYAAPAAGVAAVLLLVTVVVRRRRRR